MYPIYLLLVYPFLYNTVVYGLTSSTVQHLIFCHIGLACFQGLFANPTFFQNFRQSAPISLHSEYAEKNFTKCNHCRPLRRLPVHTSL
ncbi:hypothetical protein C8R42DRAFT_166909 [Lentinula raphanica]|nr:hypothetical protein C8R42DRAFT_166909 [Lentinula raphanica]